MPVDGFSQSVSGVEGVVNRERAEDLRLVRVQLMANLTIYQRGFEL